MTPRVPRVLRIFLAGLLVAPLAVGHVRAEAGSGPEAIPSRPAPEPSPNQDAEAIWRNLSAPLLAALEPNPRSGAIAVYDATGDRLILVGGNGSRDAWELSLATERWRRLSSSSPINDAEGGALYDGHRNRVVLVHSTGVWALPLTEPVTWTALATTGTAPGWLTFSTAHDTGRDRFILFNNYSGVVATLSLSEPAVWATLDATGTPPQRREHASTLYDPIRDRLLVFAGGSFTDRVVNSVWELTLSGTPAWRELETRGATPPVLSNHSALYDPRRDEMVVFGGARWDQSYPSVVGETWHLTLSGTPTWTQGAGSSLLRRDRHAAAIDRARDRMVVFGGSTDLVPSRLLSDTWSNSLESGQWHQVLSPEIVPPKVTQHSAIYDPTRRRMIVFGGSDVSPTNALWAYDLGEPGAWTRLSPAGAAPPPRSDHSATYDPYRDRMIVFGGKGASGYLGDAWALSFTPSLEWSPLAAEGPPPADRGGHLAVHDAGYDRLVIFGGTDGHAFQDVWQLDLSGTPTWSPLAVQGTPPRGRAGASGIWDDRRGVMVVFGGLGSAAFGDTWELSLRDPPTWSLRSGTNRTLSTRYDYPAIHDPVEQRMLVLGSNTWGLGLSGWQELSVAGDAFSSRVGHSAIYVPEEDQVLVFGGPVAPAQAFHSLSFKRSLVPALVSLVSARAEPGRVAVSWRVATALGSARVQRRDAAAGWLVRARVSPDATGEIAYEDHDVANGRTYGYRLALEMDHGEGFAGEVWVTVPGAPRFELRGLGPNPASGANAAVRFSLPGDAPARIELMDVAGRRVWSREVGSLGAGSHVIPLRSDTRPRAGVYLIRLSSGGRVATGRAVLVD